MGAKVFAVWVEVFVNACAHRTLTKEEKLLGHSAAVNLMKMDGQTDGWMGRLDGD